LTGVLRRLEERGALERRRVASDGRRAELYLTDEGRRIDKCQVGTVESVIRRALVRLNPREVSAARSVLGAIAVELEALGPQSER
jgi:DNA-binding MarR family transcriptional regulator